VKEEEYLGRVVPHFPKQAEEFRRQREQTGQAEDDMENGRPGHTFKVKRMLGMKQVGGDIYLPS